MWGNSHEICEIPCDDNPNIFNVWLRMINFSDGCDYLYNNIELKF